MKNTKITIDYDEEADVLYISFGEPTKAITEELGDVNIRINEKSNEIVGLTVLNFLENFKKKHEPIKIKL